MADYFDDLADKLAADYARDLPKPIADRVFALAWEHGHANGEGEVEFYYVDFADLAGDAYRVGFERGRS
jgi:hypothetical protein